MSGQSEEPRPTREWLKFGILAIVLIILPVSCLAARPLVFGKIVPAVIGEGIELPTAEPTTEEEAPIVEEQPAVEPEEPEAVEEATESAEEAVTEDETAEPETAGEAEVVDETTEAETPDEEEVTDETAVSESEAETLTHTVKQGENLQTIAAQYNVTPADIIATNKLTNPNYIRVGDTLLIPQPADSP